MNTLQKSGLRIVVFSDVHGNLPAFLKMLEHAGHADMFICLGDLVNYGPWSNECVDLALSLHNCICLMGNHERAFINRFYPGKNVLVQTFFETCIKGFVKYTEIEKFAESFKLEGYCFTHTILNKYIYPDTNLVLDSNYVIGHSHHQFEYHYGDFTLYNTGSVGQNRKYINVINYIIFDTISNVFKMESLIYDTEPLIKEMRARKYPEECIEYYLNKERA